MILRSLFFSLLQKISLEALKNLQQVQMVDVDANLTLHPPLIFQRKKVALHSTIVAQIISLPL